VRLRLQAGAEHQDVVLLMNQQGADELKTDTGIWERKRQPQAPVEGKKQPKALVGRRRFFSIPIPAHLFHAPTRADQRSVPAQIRTQFTMVYDKDTSFQAMLCGQVQPPASAQQFLSAWHRIDANSH